MNNFVIAVVALTLLSFGGELQAAGNVSSTDNAVYQLAQKCVAIQSPATGKFLKKTSNALGVLYRFQNTSSGDAAHFYMKPAALGEYLLTDREGNYLASLVPSTETAVGKPSLASEWQMYARKVGANSFQFKLENRLTRHPIQLEYWAKRPLLWGLTTWELRKEQYFNLVEQGDCAPYPEMTVNVRGDRNALKGDVNAPVRGFIDAHTHITSNEFMGGKVVHGDPFHRWGVPYALRDSKDSHGPNGTLDLIGNIYTFENPANQYDTRGWPDFPWWPNPKQLTHTGYYYKWIERAWLSGQRMMVTFLVENEVLCRVQRTVNPIAWQGNNCNEMDSIRFQMKRLRQMQDYIDAQYGGPGKGFFRIVTSPAQARRVIADGKLAVFVGVEISEIFNCGGLDRGCSNAAIEQGLIELYNLGIRSSFIAHKFDNQLSGSILEEGILNIGQALSNGYYYQTKECDAQTGGRSMSAGLPFVGDVPFISYMLDQAGVYPSYDQNIEHHCNARGLSPLGVYLINRMIDLGMLIEIDHLSADAVTQTIDIAEARNYSGVVSSHSYTYTDRNGDLHYNFKRMLHLGGFSAPYNADANGMKNRVEKYLDAVESTPFLQGVGIGTDMGGLGGQAHPRSDTSAYPLQYPFTTEFGLTFDRQVSGNRTFDLNKDGVAHYGMVADHIQDIRMRSGTRVYEAVMNSAEAFLQMWERAAVNNDK